MHSFWQIDDNTYICQLSAVKIYYQVVKRLFHFASQYKLFTTALLCVGSFAAMGFLGIERSEALTFQEVTPLSAEDIHPVEDTLVKPLIYRSIQGMDTLPPEQLVKRFVDVILPAVLVVKRRIEQTRKRVARLKEKERWDAQDSVFFSELSDKYKADDMDDLLRRMHTHPNSIVLAQAAMESGWGTSRFSKEANNLFGVWSFNPDEPRIRALHSRGEKSIYLKKYEDLSLSIEDYFLVLARAGVYEGFRKSRMHQQDPYEMVNHLLYYSELRWKYVRQIKFLMKKYDLTQYDQYKIDPQYIVTRKRIKWLK